MTTPVTAKSLVAASGGDTVKLFDISQSQNRCVLTYVPSSQGLGVNSVKWNHNNLVLASAGDDGKISLWRRNGQSLFTLPSRNAEPSESISSISFSNKGSRYLCSGGTGQVVRIWDLQNKRCIKWLKGHTDSITGVMYNCKDEHIASISRKGDLILHSLASGTRTAEFKDPNGQVLGALDYSRMSRHLLVTAGDDGSIRLWDTTGRGPKVSWLNQHSAPTSGVSFSPSNDKIIASVGLDMKLYTFDTGSRKPSSCIPYEAPFTSFSFNDDGFTLAAGTSTGQVVFYDTRGKPQPITVLRAYGSSEAVTNLCWQRSKARKVNENNCTDENVLLAGDVGDSIIMPDPLPSRGSGLSMPTTVSASRNPILSAASGALFSSSASGSESTSSIRSSSASEETPLRSSLLVDRTLGRLQAPRSYNIKDDMEVFSPLVEVQPLTPTLDKLWDNHDGPEKELDRYPSFVSSQMFDLSVERANDNHPSYEWKSSSASKLDNVPSTFSQLTEAPGGEKLLDKCIRPRKSVNRPSRFASLTSSSSSASGLMLSGLQNSSSSLTSCLSPIKVRDLETSDQDNSPRSSKAVLSPSGTKSIMGQSNLDNLGLLRRFSSYAEASSPRSFGSPKSKKTGAETREELLNSFLSKSGVPTNAGTGKLATTNDGGTQLQENCTQSDSLQQGSSFTLQRFQRTLEETLASFQNSIHEDVRNLHIEVLRQSHMQEMEMSNGMRLILENQAEIMKELQSLRRETHRISQWL